MNSLQSTETLKKQLLKNVENLPEPCIQEILDFAEFIRSRGYQRKSPGKKSKLAPQKDPILKLMGLADVEPFASKVDQELYGQ